MYELMMVDSMDGTGWWRTTTVASRGEPSQSGLLVASNYITPLPQVLVLYAWPATQPREMSIQEGQVLSLIAPDYQGWSKGVLLAEGAEPLVGWFPSSYVHQLESTTDGPTEPPLSETNEAAASDEKPREEKRDGGGISTDLAKLADVFEKGLLTHEEFAAAKAKALGLA
jgi:hypothetical protein